MNALSLFITDRAANKAALDAINRLALKGAKPITRYTSQIGPDRAREHGYRAAVRLRSGRIVPLSQLN